MKLFLSAISAEDNRINSRHMLKQTDQPITAEGKSSPKQFICEKNSIHCLSSFLFSCRWDQAVRSVRMIVGTSRSSFLDPRQVHRYSRSNSRQRKVNVCQASEFALLVQKHFNSKLFYCTNDCTANISLNFYRSATIFHATQWQWVIKDFSLSYKQEGQ